MRLFKAAVILTFGFLVSCASDKPDSSAVALEPLTKETILVGDTQEHDLGGLPVSFVTSSTSDFLAEVTIRPPQQSLFGRKLMQSIVEKNPGLPLIHLGDLLDVSCREEWDRISPIVLKSNIAMAHGNHDGLAHGMFNKMGESGGKNMYTGKGWRYECFRPFVYNNTDPQRQTGESLSNVWTSADFIVGYVKSKTSVGSVPVRKDFYYELPGMVSEIRGHIEPESDCFNKGDCLKFTQSYMVQKVKLPSSGKHNVYMVLIDTSQFDRDFELERIRNYWILGDLANAVHRLLFDNPGVKGSVLPDQIQVIRTMIYEKKKDDILVFGGHHDWNKLDDESKKLLSGVFSTLTDQPLVYFSAHTHTGFMKQWKIEGGRSLAEVNVNSLADWPVGIKVMKMDMASDRSLIRVNAAIKMESAKDKVERKNLLADSWKNACLATGAITEQSFKNHAGIVDAHREKGQGFWNYMNMGFHNAFLKNGSTDRNLRYEDKFNDLSHAKAVVEQALVDLPGFRDRLSKYLINKPDGVCKSRTFDDCFKNVLTIPQWKLYGEDKRDKDAKDYYWAMAELYSAAQMAVTDSNNPNEVAYMKCAFVSAAIRDDYGQRYFTRNHRADPPLEYFSDSIDARM